MNITSNAKWSKIENTSDFHTSVESAEAVCGLLMKEYRYNPCSIRGYCLDSWVEINGERQL